jgi:hypothetical protein
MNHPYLTMKLASDDDSTRRIEAVYPLSIFFAFGIYLVFQRYQIRYNAAVPFDFPSPDVCSATLLLKFLIFTNFSTLSKLVILLPSLRPLILLTLEAK